MPAVGDPTWTVNGVAPEAHPRLGPHVAAREEDFGGLVFNRVTGQIFVVNAIGLRVLRTCDGRRSVAEIVREIQARYRKAPGEFVGRTVVEFIGEMMHREFLREAADEHAPG